MGKASQQQLPVVRQQQGAAGGGGGGSRVFCCQRCSAAFSRIARHFNFKCVLVLILSVAVFMFSLLSVVHLGHKNSGYDAKESIKLSATIQANFKLQKPVSHLIHHMAELEYDIFGEIGVPSSKVVILSMHSADVLNITNVVFGVLSDPPNVSISPVFSSLLKSSFVELFLLQSNLTLTNATFGQPSSFEILKFPGGITLIPEQLFPIRQLPQILFNFSLENSVEDIKDNFVALKGQLKFGLGLKPYENVYVQVTNEKGSTTEAPVLVEASVTSNFGLLSPQRLKELAEKIRESFKKNLGLDVFVFGKVKEVRLSATLDHPLDSLSPSPSPSPSPTLSPSPALPSQFDPPAFAPSIHKLAPCSTCDTSARAGFSHASAPSPQDQNPDYSPLVSISPAPSLDHKSPNCGSRISLSPSSVSHINPPDSNLSPSSSTKPLIFPVLPPIPVVSYGSDGNGKAMESPPHE